MYTCVWQLTENGEKCCWMPSEGKLSRQTQNDQQPLTSFLFSCLPAKVDKDLLSQLTKGHAWREEVENMMQSCQLSARKPE